MSAIANLEALHNKKTDNIPKEVVDISDVLKKVETVSGCLEKYKDPSWMERWIKLNIKTQNLHYYMSEKDLKKEKTRGVYPLAGASITKSFDKDTKYFIIKITYNITTTITFRGRDFYDIQAWYLLLDEVSRMQGVEYCSEELKGIFEVKYNQKWKKKEVHLDSLTRKLKLIKSNRESISPDCDFDIGGGVVEQLKSYGKSYDIKIINRSNEEMKLRTEVETRRHVWYCAIMNVMYNNVVSAKVSDDLNIKEGYISVKEVKAPGSPDPTLIIDGLQFFHSSVKRNLDKVLRPQFLIHEGNISKVMNMRMDKMQTVLIKTGFCLQQVKEDSSYEFVRLVKEISARDFLTHVNVQVLTDALKYQK